MLFSFNQNLTLRLFGTCLLLAVFSCEETQNPDNQQPDSPEAAYNVGDIGPAGGLIFYVKDTISDGWQFIEVTADDLGAYEWGCFNSSISKAREAGIGAGEENTTHILDFHEGFQNYYNNPTECSDMSDGTVAAKVCSEWDVNGFDDWHLPSADEMNLIYQNLHLKGLGDFNTNLLYWTSTEHDDNTAVAVDFTTGNGGFLCKQCEEVVTVRAIRYF